jgi:hypothetical protein
MGAAAALLKRPFIRSAGVSLMINVAVVITLRIVISGETLEQHPALLHLSNVISAAAFANLIGALRFSRGETWLYLKSDIHRRLARFLLFCLRRSHAPPHVHACGRGLDVRQRLAGAAAGAFAMGRARQRHDYSSRRRLCFFPRHGGPYRRSTLPLAPRSAPRTVKAKPLLRNWLNCPQVCGQGLPFPFAKG